MRSGLFCVSLLLLGIRDDEESVLCKSLTVGD